jgi:hypothetical protein
MRFRNLPSRIGLSEEEEFTDTDYYEPILNPNAEEEEEEEFTQEHSELANRFDFAFWFRSTAL